MTDPVLDPSERTARLGPFVSRTFAERFRLKIRNNTAYESRLSFEKQGEHPLQAATFPEEVFEEHPELLTAEGLAVIEGHLMPERFREPNQRYEGVYWVIFRYNLHNMTEETQIQLCGIQGAAMVDTSPVFARIMLMKMALGGRGGFLVPKADAEMDKADGNEKNQDDEKVE